MTSFCSQCGSKFSSNDRFCGTCGEKLFSLCQSCSQEWNQDPENGGSYKRKIEKKTPKILSPNVEPSPKVKGVGKSHTARVQPIYGSVYKKGQDCPNCGALGMGKKNCTLCESKNN